MMLGKVGTKVRALSENVNKTITGKDVGGIEAIAAGNARDSALEQNLTEGSAKILEPLTDKQCQIMNIVIANVKQYFHN